MWREAKYHFARSLPTRGASRVGSAMRSMKVLRVLLASRRGASGIRTYTDNLAQGLGSLGHQVLVLDETIVEPRSEGNGVTAMPFAPPPKLPPRLKRFDHIAGWMRSRDVDTRAEELGVDLVHATDLELAPAVQPLVVTAWDPVSSAIKRLRLARARGEDPLAELAYALVDARAYRRAQAIVAVTDSVAAALQRHPRVETIFPFLPDYLIHESTRRSNTVCIAANAFGPKKGLEVAISAVSIVRQTRPNVRLMIVGRGSALLRASALPAFCDVMGALSAVDLRATLAQAGCVVIPSLWEEFGYIGLEALAAGTPVACFSTVGMAALPGGGVFVSRSFRSEDLAREILSAIDTERFVFPIQCRASQALPRIISLYQAVLVSRN